MPQEAAVGEVVLHGALGRERVFRALLQLPVEEGRSLWDPSRLWDLWRPLDLEDTKVSFQLQDAAFQMASSSSRSRWR